MFRLLTTLVVIGVITVPALADWNPGDPYKMHYPQLPDPTGWDVQATAPMVLADDWLCTESGPVSDIHFWGSWHQDLIGQIANIHVSIHADVSDPAFSHPGDLLWERDFVPGEWSERPYGTGDQGWADPSTGTWLRPDHMEFFQYNIQNIPNPFDQVAGTIYWLDVSVTTGSPDTLWGWKTSLDHWNDDAVWSAPGTFWQELRDPATGESLDLAFVITPEPSTLSALVLGILALCRATREPT
jgi:hypothetical protein